MLTKTQWSYIRFWVIALVIAEFFMLTFSKHLVMIYFVIAGLFLAGFLLRKFKRYPGKSEPLILDASAVFIAVLFAFCAYFSVAAKVRFILILMSSAIVLPHLVHIVSNKDIT